MFPSMVGLLILLLTNCWCQTPPQATSNGDLVNHINRLEQSLSDLRSESKTQEQKYAAVLSNVLSKLTTNSDELTALKTNQTATETELAEVKTKLIATEEQLKHVTDTAEQNTTSCSDELANVLSKVANTSEELSLLSKDFEETKLDFRKTASSLQQLNISTNHYPPSNGNRDSVAFQVTQSSHRATGITLKFDTVDFNSGNSYGKTTGIFTAPISGTYIFWANVLLSNNVAGRYSIYLYKGTVKIAEGYTNMQPLKTLRGQPVGQDIDLVSIMTVSYLNKNDQVHFRASLSGVISGDGHSSYGGALLDNK